jgi:hypothetical protein
MEFMGTALRKIRVCYISLCLTNNETSDLDGWGVPLGGNLPIHRWREIKSLTTATAFLVNLLKYFGVKSID